MDDMAVLTNKTKFQAIGATRDFQARGNRIGISRGSAFEMKLALLLDHGRWIKTGKIKELCQQNGEGFTTVANSIGLCQSESGRWCCIPKSNTPEKAPDEAQTGRKSQ